MIKRILCLLFAILLSSCMGYGPIDEEAFDVGGDFGNGDEVTYYKGKLICRDCLEALKSITAF